MCRLPKLLGLFCKRALQNELHKNSALFSKETCQWRRRGAWNWIATYCNTLQRPATHCYVLQRTATHCSTRGAWIWMGHVTHTTVSNATSMKHMRLSKETFEKDSSVFATYCNTMQRPATHCNALHSTATHYNTLQHRPTKGTLKKAAAGCSVCWRDERH